MKKIISLLIVMTMFLGIVPVPTAFAANYYYFESFEDENNHGWTIAPYKKEDSGNGMVEGKLDEYIGGSDGQNMLWIKDTSSILACHNHSPKISVTPGMKLGLFVDALIYEGSLFAMLRFFDANANKLNADAVVEASGYYEIWKEYVVGTEVPQDARYVEVWLYTNSGNISDGYFDNVRIVKDYVYVKAEQEITLDPPLQETPQNAEIVEPVGDKLIYNEYDKNGNKLSDFSYAGYYAGKIALPDSSKLAQFQTLYPITGSADDTARIQEVLNNANAKYEETGKMQVVKLAVGRYNINGDGLKLKSGVVLAGEGQDENGTVIYALAAEQHNVIKIEGSAVKKISENAYITDTYIPSGSNQITIEAERISDYQVGDLISICHPNDNEWNEAMGMRGNNMTYTFPDDYEDPNKAGTTNNTSWDAGDINVRLERTITKIEGNKITVDFPFFVPYDTNYSKMYIYKTDDSGRYENVGIENLRVESYYDGTATDEKHAYIAIRFSNAKNCYVRDVSTKYILHSLVQCQTGAKQITIQNCSSMQPVSKIAGSRRYTFYTGPETQQNLIIGCYSYDGRHDYCTSYHSTGPTVFADSVIDESNSQSETHGSWSTGAMYDNIYAVGSDSKGFIASTNRGVYGTSLSQGWSGAGIVAWNCLANTLLLQKPLLTYQNFIVGQWGFYDDSGALERKTKNASAAYSLYKTNDIPAGEADASVVATKDGTSFVGDAYKESEFAPVNPRSLYKAQLAERITGSYKNAKPNAPVIVNPRSDNKEEENTITIKGLYQKGASAVNVYIDNQKYSAVLNTSNYTFSLTVTLNNGTHKIYATQVIDGVEGTKCADRFVNVIVAGNRWDYLSSGYSKELLSHISNDTRLTYDEYENLAVNFKAVIDKEEIIYGDTAKISVENSGNYTDFVYNSEYPSIAKVASDGTVTGMGIGTTEITVYAKDKNGNEFSDTVSITVEKREITLTAIDFENNKVTANNVVEGDVLSYDIKYILKEKGDKTSVVTAVRILIFGDKKDCYYTNSTLDTTMPSEYIVMEGEGTDSDPYIIDTVYKFENAFADTGDGNLRNSGYTFLQTEDIVLTNYVANTGDDYKFKGKYLGGDIASDGNIVYSNKKITVETSGYTYASLFGYTNTANIENIDVYGTIKNSVYYTGAIAGKIEKTSIKNCNNYAAITSTSYYGGGLVGRADLNSTITNCHNYGLVKLGAYAGGIAGYITNSTVSDCSNNAEITGTSSYLGGIVGHITASGVVKNSANNGTVYGVSYVGGIAGRNTNIVESSVNNGKVVGTGSYIGGIAGQLLQGSKVALCENRGEVKGRQYIGGIAGASTTTATGESSAAISKCANLSDVTASTYYVGGILGAATGNKKTTTVSECFNKGKVTAKEVAGGIVGDAYNASADGCRLIVSDCMNEGTVSTTITGSTGLVVGRNSAMKGLSITNFYDINNDMDIIGSVVDYKVSVSTTVDGTTTTTSVECEIPAPVIQNAFIASSTNYTYAEETTAAAIKNLVKNKIFSNDIWTDVTLSGYPELNWATDEVLVEYDLAAEKITVLSRVDGKLYIAAYNSDGILTGVKIYDLSENASYDFNSYNKAFFWNSSMMPLINNFEI